MTNNSITSASNAMKFHGKAAEWIGEDLTTRFSPLIAQGFGWSVEQSKLVNPMRQHSCWNMETPWCHSVSTYHKMCGFDHHICFNNYKIIPPRCLNCWKVVATPQTFEQLIYLEDAQLQTPWASKCGIEVRSYTPKHYGAYWYNNSLDEGLDKVEKVRNLLIEAVPDGKELAKEVILKRGCTEFEFLKGPSPYWSMTAKEAHMYELLLAYVDNPRPQTPQPSFLKIPVRLRWMKHAHSRGDMTYMKWNGGKSLYPDYVKYQDKDVDHMKAEIAAAQANNISEDMISMEDAKEFMQVADDFAKAKELPLAGLTHALGTLELNQLNPTSYPKEVIGDEDQSV